VACCKRQPGSLILEDVAKIVAYVAQRDNVSVDFAYDWVKERLWASPGALVKDSNTGKTYRIGTITPRFRKGRCVFLTEDDKCSIHEVAPFGCAYFDTHMPPSVAMPRSLFACRNHTDPIYQALRNELPYATHHKPTPY
jgi:Fe-S-cluster containining protein